MHKGRAGPARDRPRAAVRQPLRRAATALAPAPRATAAAAAVAMPAATRREWRLKTGALPALCPPGWRSLRRSTWGRGPPLRPPRGRGLGGAGSWRGGVLVGRGLGRGLGRARCGRGSKGLGTPGSRGHARSLLQPLLDRVARQGGCAVARTPSQPRSHGIGWLCWPWTTRLDPGAARRAPQHLPPTVCDRPPTLAVLTWCL